MVSRPAAFPFGVWPTDVVRPAFIPYLSNSWSYHQRTMKQRLSELIPDSIFFVNPDLEEGGDNKRTIRLLFSLAAFFTFGCVGWFMLLWWLGLIALMFVPAIYVVITVVNLMWLYRLWPGPARFLQVASSLLLPFALQSLLGGIYPSGVMILWSAVSAFTILGAQVRWHGIVWLIGFLILFISSFLFDGYFASRFSHPQITEPIARTFLAVNIAMITLVTVMVARSRMNLDRFFIARLQASNDELESYKQELEQRIRERTNDLESSVALLRETKNEMKKALVRAKEATESKSYYLTNVSHEIRTPLNAIIGYAQIMEMKSRDITLSADFISCMRGIRSSGDHLLELINNVLDISRIDSGKMQLSMETVNIRQLIKKVYEINLPKAEQQGKHFSYSFDAALPELVETDAAKVTQILMNLCSNAIKFTPEGKRIALTVRLDGRYIVFRVEDEGIGIAAENHELIFQPFTQAENSITKKYGGTGLGLAITRRLTELFNGKIMVESELEKGSVFTVYLPLIRAVSAESNQQSSDDFYNVRFMEGQKVLIVEDNAVNMQVLSGFLKEVGLTVFQAFNGREGVQMAMQERPDVVFMDIHMPEMDGLEATKVLVSIDELRGVPVVCLTADVFGDQRKNFLSLGFSDFLTKPVEFRRIVEVLEKYLRTA